MVGGERRQSEKKEIQSESAMRNQMETRIVTKFSVLIPVHNREGLIAATIDSVLSQTFTDYEVIVVDDGSTDRTGEVLRSYGTRINVIHQENQGPEIARSRGAAMACGEYLVFLDSDDLLTPWALATYNRIIESAQSPALITAALTYYREGQRFPEQGERVAIRLYPDYLSKDVTQEVSCSVIVIARAAYERCGGLRRSTPKTFHMDNHDMLLRFGSVGPCVVVQEPLTVLYRMHEGNCVKDVQKMVEGALAVIATERQGRYPGAARRRFGRYALIGGMAG